MHFKFFSPFFLLLFFKFGLFYRILIGFKHILHFSFVNKFLRLRCRRRFFFSYLNLFFKNITVSEFILNLISNKWILRFKRMRLRWFIANSISKSLIKFIFHLISLIMILKFSPFTISISPLRNSFRMLQHNIYLRHLAPTHQVFSIFFNNIQDLIYNFNLIEVLDQKLIY